MRTFLSCNCHSQFKYLQCLFFSTVVTYIHVFDTFQIFLYNLGVNWRGVVHLEFQFLPSLVFKANSSLKMEMEMNAVFKLNVFI